jgi:hypothetical protein
MVEELINLIDGRWDVALIKSLFWPVDVHRILFQFIGTGRIWLLGTSTETDYSQSNRHFIVNGNPNSGPGLLHHQQEDWGWTQCGRNFGNYRLPARRKFLHGERCMAVFHAM